jgi:hypothetical protein
LELGIVPIGLYLSAFFRPAGYPVSCKTRRALDSKLEELKGDYPSYQLWDEQGKLLGYGVISHASVPFPKGPGMKRA